MNGRRPLPPGRLACGLPLLLAACASRGPSPLERVQELRRLQHEGRTEEARALLAPDARIWFGARSGQGRPWRLDGPWKHWDEVFRSESTLSGWRVEGRTVTVVSLETNDFYRLIERAPQPVRLTWYLDEQGRIEGFLVSEDDLPPAPGGDRLDEARAWAREHRADELAYLEPEGRLDPSADRPERWRALLLAWRDASGLPDLGLAADPGAGAADEAAPDAEPPAR